MAPPLQHIKALTFDVFGTCVDWRTSVVSALGKAAAAKIESSSFSSLPAKTQTRLQALSQDGSWGIFAQEWRHSYGQFTRGFVPGETAWKDIDTHHRDSLLSLLDKWQLSGVYDPAEIEALSKVWHYLDPWSDSSEGIHALGKRFATATLSNGNQSLLADLNSHGNLGFQRLISAEDFRAYKPNPAVYLGACRLLGLEPGQVAMAAAHLGDLAAARDLGLRTIYVERSREEEWQPDEERYREARQWVDLWVSEGEGGFIQVAKRLGL
ncbi:HAD-like domain-containing protein [Apodospora peruviana]|uniref:HAD-like domain-containing protein n=1 Tax=Apodospora peruviana TaxID=516989 RepID=A0AAE0IHN8_9PEZI|nr:HAD-like domain-containing protein [Apodospora peruviana]